MAKRKGQWFGDRRQQAVRDIPTTADVIQLLPPATALESIRDIVFERVIIGFSIQRINTNSISDLSWMAYHGRVANNTLIPLEALNPRLADETTMAHSSIVQFGVLPVPEIHETFDSAGAVVAARISEELMTVMVDFDVKRSIQRGNEGIWLTMAAAVTLSVRVSVNWRTYYTYA